MVKKDDIFDCFSKVGLGLDLLDNIYSYKDQGIQENFKIKLNAKEIVYVSGKIKRNYKIISKRNKPNGSVILVSHYINKDYYGGYMLTLSINYESNEYLYSSMMGAGEILEGPVGKFMKLIFMQELSFQRLGGLSSSKHLRCLAIRLFFKLYVFYHSINL